MRVNSGEALRNMVETDKKLLGLIAVDRLKTGSSTSLTAMVTAFLGTGIVIKLLYDAIVSQLNPTAEKEEEPTEGPMRQAFNFVRNLVSPESKDTPKDEKPKLATVASPVPKVESTRINSGSKVAAATMSIPDAIKAASDATGVSFTLLYKVLGAESDFRVDAQASTSGALGIAQMVPATWNELTTKEFPELGYSMADRLDPVKASRVAGLYLKKIENMLTKALGRAPSDREIYAGYVLGPTGARKLLDQIAKNPDAVAAPLFPKAAAANVNLFYEKGNTKKPFTVAQVLGAVDVRVSKYAPQAQQQLARYTPSSSGNLPAVASASPVVVDMSMVTQVSQVIEKPELPDSLKIRALNPEPTRSPSKASASTPPPTTAPSKTSPTKSRTLVRDRQNRLVSVKD